QPALSPASCRLALAVTLRPALRIAPPSRLHIHFFILKRLQGLNLRTKSTAIKKTRKEKKVEAGESAIRVRRGRARFRDEPTGRRRKGAVSRSE
ncbi:hypothetical protein, partial [Pantoea sp. UBA6567]|uniref:hypothetical protein n=1 Tax=Pantoea sp. UBA6567 TaxID=1947043 RepID=UPI002595CE2F